MEWFSKLVCNLIILILRIYQLMISPFFPSCCRFNPTCSEYCKEAFKRHTLPKAVWLSIYRLLRCQPFAKHGYDPVPTQRKKTRR